MEKMVSRGDAEVAEEEFKENKDAFSILPFSVTILFPVSFLCVSASLRDNFPSLSSSTSTFSVGVNPALINISYSKSSCVALWSMWSIWNESCFMRCSGLASEAKCCHCLKLDLLSLRTLKPVGRGWPV